MEKLRIGLCGFGTVGESVFRLLREDNGRVNGHDMRVVHLASRSLSADSDAQMRCGTDILAVAHDPEVNVLVELIGGTEAARELVLTALGQGKHVVTANKALLAEHGAEIFAAAHKSGVAVACEAAVAGGLPLLRTLSEGLAANRIRRLAGIINGTGNFILTRMREESMGFAEALAEAQRLGYAEADATLDVGGGDAAHKLVLTATLIWGLPSCDTEESVSAEEELVCGVRCLGVDCIEREDLVWAERFGYCIKPLAMADFFDREQGAVLRVYPALVSKEHILAHVDGEMNAMWVEGDLVAQNLYYGPGAGGEATASAVLADLVALAAGRGGMSVAPAGFRLLSPDRLERRQYLRLQVEDHPGVLASVSRVLADAGINVLEAQQKPDPKQRDIATLALLLGKTNEKCMRETVKKLARLEEIRGDIVRLRVEDFQYDDAA